LLSPSSLERQAFVRSPRLVGGAKSYSRRARGKNQTDRRSPCPQGRSPDVRRSSSASAGRRSILQDVRKTLVNTEAALGLTPTSTSSKGSASSRCFRRPSRTPTPPRRRVRGAGGRKLPEEPRKSLPPVLPSDDRPSPTKFLDFSSSPSRLRRTSSTPSTRATSDGGRWNSYVRSRSPTSPSSCRSRSSCSSDSSCSSFTIDASSSDSDGDDPFELVLRPKRRTRGRCGSPGKARRSQSLSPKQRVLPDVDPKPPEHRGAAALWLLATKQTLESIRAAAVAAGEVVSAKAARSGCMTSNGGLAPNSPRSRNEGNSLTRLLLTAMPSMFLSPSPRKAGRFRKHGSHLWR
jgi:hypothetical protein